MQAGEHDWPEEFRDEDKWVFLTKRQWLIIIVGFLLGGLIALPFILLGLTFLIPVLLVAVWLIELCAVIIALKPIPSRFYLFGAGEWMEKILFRWLKKQGKSSKKIYVSNLDNGSADWDRHAKMVREIRRKSGRRRPGGWGY